jgi:CBS-domain-containing membrane protein
MEQVMNTKAKAIALSYFRAGMAAMLAMFINGTTEPKSLAIAALAAIAGPALKALDVNSPEFGLGSKK